MKISQEKKNTNTAKRTINAFSSALIDLLQKNKLEQITITMLCEESTYPRSTFYNYFEDIFDLLDCILEKLFYEVSLSDFQTIDPNIRSILLFERAYDVLNRYSEIITNIVKKNDYNGSFLLKVRSSIRGTISYIIENSECIAQFKISKEIVQTHYSNTIELVLEQCFLTIEPITKEDAIKTLDFLLGTLEREVKKNEKYI
jgi:AcrR family transcriptional regulator